MNSNMVKKMTVTGLLMAMVVVLSTVSLPVPGGHLYFCDVAICTGAILTADPFMAFLIGGLGSFLGDLLFYPQAMFVSLISHGLQAVVIALFMKYMPKKHPMVPAIIGVLAGGVVMVTGYTLGRAYVYSTPEASLIKLPFECFQAGVGAVLSILLCFSARLYHIFRTDVEMAQK